MCSSHDSHESRGQADDLSAAPDTAATSPRRVYTVQGMTCEHCAASVSEEVAQVDGVTALEVDLETSRLSVLGEGFSDEAIRAAVDEAGYEVAGA